MAGRAVRHDRQRVDQADDDAFVQHARDGRHHAGRLLALGGAQLEELRLRAARRHLLGRLPLDLFLGAARARASANASSRRRCGAARPASATALGRQRRARAPTQPPCRTAAAWRARISSPRGASAARKPKDAHRTPAAVAPPRYRKKRDNGRAASRCEEPFGGRRNDRSARRADAPVCTMRRWSKATKKSRSTSMRSKSPTRSRRAARRRRQHPLKGRARTGLPATDTVGSRVRGGLSQAGIAAAAPPRVTPRDDLRRARLRQERRVSARPVCDHRRRGRISTPRSRAFRSKDAKTLSRDCAPARPRPAARAGEPVRRQCGRRATTATFNWFRQPAARLAHRTG